MRTFILGVVATGLSVGVAVAGPGGKGGNGGGPGSQGSHPSTPSQGSHGHWGVPSGMGHGSSHGGTPSHSPMKYHEKYGKSFSHGWYYPGKDHSHWTYHCYSPKYGCECYWCPYTTCYYYWCPSASCYYPMSYYNSAPPTQVATQTQAQGLGGPPPGVRLPPQ